MCLCISTIMVLHRLLMHTLNARLKVNEGAQKGFKKGQDRRFLPSSPDFAALVPHGDKLPQLLFKISSFIVLGLSVAGICCGLADAVFYNAMRNHLKFASTAVNGTSGANTPESLKFKGYSEAAGFFQLDARSAQHFCEVVALHLLIVMFVVVGRARYAFRLFPVKLQWHSSWSSHFSTCVIHFVDFEWQPCDNERPSREA
jgi:hypothetical protein